MLDAHCHHEPEPAEAPLVLRGPPAGHAVGDLPHRQGVEAATVDLPRNLRGHDCWHGPIALVRPTGDVGVAEVDEELAAGSDPKPEAGDGLWGSGAARCVASSLDKSRTWANTLQQVGNEWDEWDGGLLSKDSG